MAKITLNDVGNFNSTGLGTLNDNYDKIATALENTLSRDGTTPNQMTSDLDLNNNDILNVDNLEVEVLTIMGERVYPDDVVTTGSLLAINNLSDLNDADVALTNLGGGAAGIDIFKASTLDALRADLGMSAADISFLQSGTDAVATTVEAKLKGWVSVKDFGATGDGVTDDTTAIQAAIDYCEGLSRGGTVHLPSGIYKITSQLIVWPWVNVIGDGSWNTVIKFAPAELYSAPAIQMGTVTWMNDGGDGTKKNFQFRGIRLEQSVSYSGSHTGTDGASVLTDSTKSWTTDALVGRELRNVTDGSRGAITANTATTVTATMLGGTDNDFDTDDTYVISGAGTGDGVYLISTAGATIADIQVTGFLGSGAIGFVLAGNATSTDAALAGATSKNCEGHYNVIIGCYFFNNCHGAYLGGVKSTGQSNSNTFLGGAFRANYQNNLILGPTNNNYFAGVSFEANPAGAGTDFGVAGVRSGCQNNVFVNCRFEGTYKFRAWQFSDDEDIKRNFMDLPTYGSNYTNLDPANASFLADSGGRNYCRVADLTGKLVLYGPSQTFVAPGSTTGLDINNLIKTYTATAVHSATGANSGISILNGRVDTSTTSTSAAAHSRFFNPNGQVGSISTSASATAFSTSSDQRLKEDEKDFDAGEIIDQLKIYDFAWRVGGSRSHGVFAQEAVEIYPQAVVEGDDSVPWSVDYSKFVPLLLREIQELRKRVTELEAT